MSSAATTYARALLEAVDASDAPRVADELDAFAGISHTAPRDWEAFIAPSVPTAARKGTIDRLMSAAHVATRNVLKLLVDKGRIEEAPGVAAAFRELVREREQQLDVHVTSAVELTPELRSKLETRLSSSTGRQVTLHTSVDPDIIGGLVVRHGDTLVDTSLRGRLDGLRLALSKPSHSAAPSSDSTTPQG